MSYNVLVVDDQTMPRQLFENIINNSDGYNLVAGVESASVADVYCAKMQVDLILMDVVMSGGINGIEAAARIKDSYPNIKIIVVTSMPDGSFLEKARTAKVDSFWYKEVESAPILDVMDRTMAGEHIYPDSPPSVRIGLVDSTEFTDREIEILRELQTGDSNTEIAGRLGISAETVKFHIKSLLQKTGFHTRTELAMESRTLGIVIK